MIHLRVRPTILAHSLLLALTIYASPTVADAATVAKPVDDRALFDPRSLRWRRDYTVDQRARPWLSQRGSESIDELSREWRRDRSRHPVSLLPPGSRAVSNCNDDGVGSLRAVINTATSGDTIDLTSMNCSEITLTTGAIVVTQNGLTLQGPTDGIMIGANYGSQVLVHSGSGYLNLDHLNIGYGANYQIESNASDARGGCIESAGIVSLNYTEVAGCVAATEGATNVARGGAIYATFGVTANSSLVSGGSATSMIDSAGGAISSPGGVVLLDSVVTGSIAKALSGSAHGGGVDAGSLFLALYASVLLNGAVTMDDQASGGGGVRALGGVDISYSSFTYNGSIEGGAIEMRGAGFLRSIWNTTVTGNVGSSVAGIFAAGSNLRISNSSIAYNDSEVPGSGVGLFVEGINVQLQSTLIAFNGDLNAGIYSDAAGSGTLSGLNNLIHSAHITPPAGTLEHVDPLVAPMHIDNWRTILALKPTSVAINAGNNTSALTYDQRGPGFPRQIGNATDIGAYEFDLGDLIFADGMESIN